MRNLAARARQAWAYAPAWAIWLAAIIVLSVLLAIVSVTTVFLNQRDVINEFEDAREDLTVQLDEAERRADDTEARLRILQGDATVSEEQAICRSQIIAKFDDATAAVTIGNARTAQLLNELLLFRQFNPDTPYPADLLQRYQEANEQLKVDATTADGLRVKRENVVNECKDGIA